ncbi:MAG: hypothetical protein RMJ75_07510 [Nitrososphaerota archaeon]|nr:hypothetical protein [Nitrososphaerota archaeon]
MPTKRGERLDIVRHLSILFVRFTNKLPLRTVRFCTWLSILFVRFLKQRRSRAISAVPPFNPLREVPFVKFALSSALANAFNPLREVLPRPRGRGAAQLALSILFVRFSLFSRHRRDHPRRDFQSSS